MSATTNDLLSLVLTTPKLGDKVVKWYAAILAFDALILEIIVDLPTEGIPTKPTSANNFNSIFTLLTSPGSPFSAKLGAGLERVAKAILPLPPRPPYAAITESSFLTKSAITNPVSASVITVPSGTLTITSSALAPCFPLPSPLAPLLPLISFLYLKSSNVLSPSSTANTIFEPLPPLPPNGPPISTYFSLLKAIQPLPPSPAIRSIVTSSTNIVTPLSKRVLY